MAICFIGVYKCTFLYLDNFDDYFWVEGIDGRFDSSLGYFLLGYFLMIEENPPLVLCRRKIHDLKNYLGAMSMAVELIDEVVPNDKKSLVKIIETNVLKCFELLEDKRGNGVISSE